LEQDESLSPLLTIPEAARRLGISERTIREVMKREGIQTVRFAGGWPRVRERDLARLIQPIEPEGSADS